MDRTIEEQIEGIKRLVSQDHLAVLYKGLIKVLNIEMQRDIIIITHKIDANNPLYTYISTAAFDINNFDFYANVIPMDKP